MTTIPAGLCQCGCGKATTIAKRERWGHTPGEYLPYLPNHSPNDLKVRRASKAAGKARCKAFVAEYLQKYPCADCGEKDPIVLQFHHRNPKTKRDSIATLIHQFQANNEVLAEEIAKCDVLCANCHLRRHAASGWEAMKTPQVAKI